MITLIRSKDGTINSFIDGVTKDHSQALGETLEYIDVSFAEYAGKFKLVCNGKSGETISVKRGSGNIVIDVFTPGVDTVDVAINGSVERLTPIGGVSHLTLSTDVAGVFIVEPADRKLFCSAGEGKMVVEVN